MKKWLNDPEIAGKIPIATTFLMGYANVGQLWRMWSCRTAAGQSLWSWLSVGLALLLWCHFYRVCCPDQKFALRCMQFGVFMNTLVILSVVWFRYI